METFTIAELADAGRAAGRIEQARTILDRLEPLAAYTTSSAFRISMNHARVQLAPDHEVESALTTALGAPGLTDWPYHRARLHLAYGLPAPRSPRQRVPPPPAPRPRGPPTPRRRPLGRTSPQ
ncbi:hypothetical protein [Streptomyces sp. NPDC054854]